MPCCWSSMLSLQRWMSSSAKAGVPAAHCDQHLPRHSGDWDRAWEIFETTYPVDGEDMPGVLDIMALDSEAEEKAARRQRELDLQVIARRSTDIPCT